MIITAQELFDQLIEIQETYGTLDVPIQIFDGATQDRYDITLMDIFTDGKDKHLHSIDLNF